MTYDIRVDAHTESNDHLAVVYLPHAPEDANKIIRLRENMMANGWQGRPVILHDAIDYHIALTGSHRIAAAQGLDDVIEAVFLPDGLSEKDWEAIDGAYDDEDVLRALETIAQDRDDMADVLDVMRAEIEANNA